MRLQFKFRCCSIQRVVLQCTGFLPGVPGCPECYAVTSSTLRFPGSANLLEIRLGAPCGAPDARNISLSAESDLGLLPNMKEQVSSCLEPASFLKKAGPKTLVWTISFLTVGASLPTLRRALALETVTSQKPRQRRELFILGKLRCRPPKGNARGGSPPPPRRILPVQ